VSKSLLEAKARLIGNSHNGREVSMVGPKPGKRCHDNENEQTVVSGKQNGPDVPGPCRTSIKISREDHYLDKLEERFERMAQTSWKHESERIHPGKRFKGQGYQTESRGLCTARCQRNKDKVKELEDKVQELQGHLGNLANALEEHEQIITKMAEREARHVQDAEQAKENNQNGIAIAKKVDQERLQEVGGLKESLARMEKTAADFRRLADVREATIKGFDTRMEEQQQLHQQQHGEFVSREQALIALVGPIVRWRGTVWYLECALSRD
jgi:hypothetical protein